ncbi:unnamed protein product [Polarella glacialis]|uniref:DUF1214 domain-containing protein n=1 Tax=Polarella glacialis TaxID=89957 RepID=A0A813LPA7_POLGL|nr:unnamed protein product [Polarella glacialis]
MNINMIIAFQLLIFLGGFRMAHAAEKPVTVTVENYLVAECDFYMGKYIPEALGKFKHMRELVAVDTSPSSAPMHGQPVIRMNRDTLYSPLIVDLSTTAEVTFPDVGHRFLSLLMLSETHDSFPSVYEPGKYLLTKDSCGCPPPCRGTTKTGAACTAIGTRYAFLILRTLADAANATDIAAAHDAQDAFAVKQEDPGKWEVPDWNQTELSRIRNDLLDLREMSTTPTTFGFFTGPEKIDHLFGLLNVAVGWGGVRPKDQTYVFWSSGGEPGDFTMTMPKVPVEANGFWSITVYSKEGFMFADPSNYNSAVQGSQGQNRDGSTTVYFGGCDDPKRQKPSKAHCLPIQQGWGTVIRFFRPSEVILDGTWVPPKPISEPHSIASSYSSWLFHTVEGLGDDDDEVLTPI